MATDGDALTCDMAQYYGILDWRSLPPPLAATLAQGLPPEARCMRNLPGAAGSREEMLLAAVADRVGHLIWMLSEDGRSGKNHPPSLLEAISGGGREEAGGYDSGADFEAAWAAITGGGYNA